MKIHKIELPTPFAVGDVNVWFIEGDQPTLIDAGVRSSKSLGVLREALSETGFRLEDIKRIFLTHYHLDHAGAAAELSALCGATVYISPRCQAQLSNVNAYRAYYRDYMERCGVPTETLELFKESNLSWAKFASDWSQVSSLHLLEDREVLAFGEDRIECVFTPGHSQDHVCFIDSQKRFAFSGDHLLAGITPNPLIYFDPENGMARSHSLLNYLDSLKKLEAHKVRLAYGGHGADISDPQALIDKNRRLIEIRCKSFLDLLRSDQGLSIYELALRHFGNLHPLEIYLAVSETIAYIDLLVQRGLAVLDESGEKIAVTAV